MVQIYRKLKVPVQIWCIAFFGVRMIWSKEQTFQSEMNEARKTEDPYIYLGCIAVSKVNAKTFRLAFTNQAKEKFIAMSCQEILFYIATILEVYEVDVINYSLGRFVSLRDFFAFKFFVETIFSLLRDKSLGKTVSTEEEAKGRYTIARGTNDQA
jgi:hypothetical protein